MPCKPCGSKGELTRTCRWCDGHGGDWFRDLRRRQMPGEDDVTRRRRRRWEKTTSPVAATVPTAAAGDASRIHGRSAQEVLPRAAAAAAADTSPPARAQPRPPSPSWVRWVRATSATGFTAGAPIPWPFARVGIGEAMKADMA
jgi:hypothetical protein